MQPRKPRGLARFEPPIEPARDSSTDCGFLSLPWPLQDALLTDAAAREAVADADLDDAERESGAYTAREPKAGRG